MARLVLADRRIDGLGAPPVAGARIGAGVHRRAIVGVHHVAGRAAARPVIAGVVVRPHEREHRIEQPRPLEADPDRIRAVERAEAARAQAVGRPAGQLFTIGHPDLERALLPPLEDAQHVAGLNDLEARQRLEELQHALARHLLDGGRRRGDHALRDPVGTVALAEAGRLEREATVVVVGSGPEHGAGGHHALGDLGHLGRVAAVLAAAPAGRPQVARVYEADEVVALLVEPRKRALWVGGALPELRMSWLHVRRRLHLLVAWCARGHPARQPRLGVAAVTVGAPELDRGALVHAL